MMKRAVSIIAVSTAAMATAQAQSTAFETTCTRGGDARTIAVIAPGEVGQSCDVRYTRSADNVSVPYHADNSDTFCNEKARAMVQRLSSAGFNCSPQRPALRAQNQTPDNNQQSDFVVEAQRVASAEPEPAPEVQQQATAPQPVVFQPAPAESIEPVDESEDALEDEMNKILAQPAIEQPSIEERSAEQPATGPAVLVAQATQTPQTGPQPSPVGRLTGADPDAPRPAVQVTQASAQETPPAQTAPAAQTQSSNDTRSTLRTPGEIIRARLQAQAAAWNEGDLDAFMEGYWKSDDLKFVAGNEITRGWSATMKRYRDRYAGGQGLGQLSFDRLETKLVTDDVAVVTGRFNHAQNGEASSGVFSLVMRRDNGAWRIVHDHTSSDQAD
ncbi:nuclear transport factor 2 family protein [Hyphococcus flavus]|uniref:Nuclear transport factor 2 family protein n=1 Tax=Hyphococcus flavus TaxID=1866326 RepID=A0AAF0CBX2_9PROT|nr:nuclear transport factor 2 family protein [Hyphococcus flavus]WDI32065.1 nuclear transport factor 2 family protein [Hyphococcus flavus]